MGLYALTSSSGAPGVSTAAIAWAYLSPRPTLIVEADVKGGSDIVAGVWEGQQKHIHSVLDLISLPAEELHEHVMERAYQLPNTTHSWVLPAIGAPVQANALTSVWPDVVEACQIISGRGVDVVIDVGRCTQQGMARPLLTQADAVVLFTDSSLQAINNAVITVPQLRAALARSGSADRLTVATVTGGKDAARLRPYTAGELGPLIAPTSIIGDIPHDPRAAAVYSASRDPQRAWLSRSYPNAIRALMDAVRAHADSVAEIISGRRTA